MADEIQEREQRKPGRTKMTDEQKKAAAEARAVSKAKAEGMMPEIVLQYGGADTNIDALVSAAILDFRSIKKRTLVNSMKIYLKPEEKTAYYVINEEYEGKVIF